jgi:MFS family permease
VAVPVTPPPRHRFSLPKDPARRVATQSLLMVAATAVAAVIAGVVGTFLQSVVFDLGEQELLSEAGASGYVAAVLLLALMVLPAVAGIALGVRARRLGEHRLGTTGMIVNAVVAVYLVFTVAATLLFG